MRRLLDLGIYEVKPYTSLAISIALSTVEAIW